jgi:hypothetical protein
MGFPYARVSEEMKRTLSTIILLVLYALVSSAQSPEFNEPWKNPRVALAIDPFEGNDIDWNRLATDRRVVAIIHRATIGDRADRKYAERRDEAKKLVTNGALITTESPAIRSSRPIFFLIPLSLRWMS